MNVIQFQNENASTLKKIVFQHIHWALQSANAIVWVQWTGATPLAYTQHDCVLFQLIYIKKCLWFIALEHVSFLLYAQCLILIDWKTKRLPLFPVFIDIRPYMRCTHRIVLHVITTLTTRHMQSIVYWETHRQRTSWSFNENSENACRYFKWYSLRIRNKHKLTSTLNAGFLIRFLRYLSMGYHSIVTTSILLLSMIKEKS